MLNHRDICSFLLKNPALLTSIPFSLVFKPTTTCQSNPLVPRITIDANNIRRAHGVANNQRFVVLKLTTSCYKYFSGRVLLYCIPPHITPTCIYGTYSEIFKNNQTLIIRQNFYYISNYQFKKIKNNINIHFHFVIWYKLGSAFCFR